MRGNARLIGAGVLVTWGTVLVAAADPPSPNNPALDRGRELFRQRIEPMLRVKCLGCHGDGEELDAELDLRTREAMLRGGKSGPSLVPGNALASLIYQAVRRDDERAMPPRDRERLAPQEISNLRAWIEAGAPWADEAGATGSR
jgi:mono/diheme cytochrome c family protein